MKFLQCEKQCHSVSVLQLILSPRTEFSENFLKFRYCKEFLRVHSHHDFTLQSKLLTIV